jgi:hypothetical protein
MLAPEIETLAWEEQLAVVDASHRAHVADGGARAPC